MRLLFIGPPGAGKGTQAEKVAARLGVPHISTGEMFRDNVARGTDLGRQVEAIMAAGDYVPDEVTVAMLAERIDEDDAAHGYILDGFPRTEAQVASLDSLLGDQGLDKVVVIDVPEDELVGRLLSRGRADDNEETIRNRFSVYLEQTQPLIDIYSTRGLTVIVDGIGEVEDVTDRILIALGRPDIT
ncbi:MAG TPA: adenylate kinase [Acidimicrobiia bacterium]